MSKAKRIGVMVLLLAAGVTFCVVAQSTAPAPAPAPAAPALQMQNEVTLIHLIKSGGWAMWPLGACSFATVSLILLNFQRVNRGKMVPASLVAQIKSAATGGDVQQVWNASASTDTFYTRGMIAGLRQYRSEDPLGSRKKMEEAISETVGREETRYAFFVNFLALLTTMSPMWGLLGTVSGMIGAFSKIGGGGMGKPEMLAKNISEALVCTASGLLIAICAMGFYFLFRNILNTVVKDAEGGYSETLDALMGQGNATFGETAAAGAQPEAAMGSGSKL
ncbi:MAG: MotA/TolQ/ExbB proton channel family protein [Kiritimatiellia bacterium]